MFNSYVYPDTRPRIDVGGILDAFTNGASSLIHAAYLRKRQEMQDQQTRDQIAYQRQRDQLADSRYDQARSDRLTQQDREFNFKQAQAGYTPETTEFDASPNALDISSGFKPDLPNPFAHSVSNDGMSPIQNALDRAARSSIPANVRSNVAAQIDESSQASGSATSPRLVGPPSSAVSSASSSDTAAPAATPSAPAPASPPQLVGPGSRTRTVPAHFDPLNSAAARTKVALADQATRDRAEAYEAAGLSSEDAAAAAHNPTLATKLLAPHGKRVYFNADGTPVVVDAQDPQFPSGFKKATPVSRPNNPRDPNISASIATDRAIKETNQAKTATLKAIQKPAAFSTNPQADSASVVGANTPLLSKAGDLAVRGDSLRRAYDQQASAIGTGKPVRAAVDVSQQRAELDRRRQQMQAIVANPQAPLSAKARAQNLFQQYVESIGGRQ